MKKQKLSPSVLDECAAHGQLAAMMTDHSSEIRTVIDYMWTGFMSANCDPAPGESAEDVAIARKTRKRYQRIHDRIARLHQNFLSNGGAR